jgi:hypothetical protein
MLTYAVSRRTFIRGGIYLLASLANFRLVQTAGALSQPAHVLVSTQFHPYGTGTYGQGSYPGTSTVDVIFQDGFETGDLSRWSQSNTDGGDLSVDAAAALVGNFGLKVLIDSNGPVYVRDNSPSAEPRYRVRFQFDPHSISMANNNAHYIFYGYQENGSNNGLAVIRVEFRRSANKYQLRMAAVNDATTWKSSNWFPISDAPHSVEFDWQAATAPGANNGSLTFWIDGVQKVQLTGIDNDTRRIDHAHWGALASIDRGTRGVYYFDAFESRRQSYIGPASTGAPQQDLSLPEEGVGEFDSVSETSFAVETLNLAIAPAADATGAPLSLEMAPASHLVGPTGSQVLGSVFTVQAFAPDGAPTALAQPATLSIDYSEASAGGDLPPGTLSLQMWNASMGVWENLPTTVDAENQTVTVMVQQLGVFALTHQGEANHRLYLPLVQR